MLLERAELQIKIGSEEEFFQVMRDRGLPLLKSVAGVQSAMIGRGVENPNKLMFLVQWSTLEAHKTFNQSVVSPEFRGLFTPFAEGGSMEHFEMHETASEL